jgi:translation initiation factor IF-3
LVRLIGPEGDQLGILPTSEAIAVAEGHELDLVEIADQADPPVCRILNYNKFKYEKTKKIKDAKKKQKVIHNREVRFRPNIEEHDLLTKVNKARQFLEAGDRVKITVMFRGREMAYISRGPILIDRIMTHLEDLGSVDKKPVMEGRFLTTVVTSKLGGK